MPAASFDLAGEDGDPATPDAARSPALASCGRGRMLAAFSRERFVEPGGGEDEGDTYHDAPRVRARFVGNPCTFGVPPVVCEPSTFRR
ncbi:hypothetical protein ACMHYB_01035 [Sorangium sp. So ce1128]